jgi:endonuclease YncB( thermonuclease family)
MSDMGNMTDDLMLNLAPKDYGTLHAFKIVRVHDGDTVIVDVRSWPKIFRPFPFRLFGYDAPELGDVRPEIAKVALAARDRLTQLLAGKCTFRLRCLDKYPRIDADFVSHGADVGQVLLTEGLVRVYTGIGPKPW